MPKCFCGDKRTRKYHIIVIIYIATYIVYVLYNQPSKSDNFSNITIIKTISTHYKNFITQFLTGSTGEYDSKRVLSQIQNCVPRFISEYTIMFFGFFKLHEFYLTL